VIRHLYILENESDNEGKIALPNVIKFKIYITHSLPIVMTISSTVVTTATTIAMELNIALSTLTNMSPSSIITNAIPV
jgi:hypothetical protein